MIRAAPARPAASPPIPRMASTSTKSNSDFGLSSGQALDSGQLAAFPFFAGRKSNFEDKLKDNMVHRVTGEPIRAAVLREYQSGDIICAAGTYGSTAFLIVEGNATAFVSGSCEPQPAAGRTARSLARLAGIFTRRSRSTREVAERIRIGEVTSCATLHRSTPPAPRALGPGDAFGVEACINFHPREFSVRADSPCKVIEMLRSVLDTVRSSGKSGASLDEAHGKATILGVMRGQELFAGMSDEQTERLAGAAELLTQDDLSDGVLYEEGSEADSVFLVASGTVKLSRKQPGGERILTYVGRSSALGIEALVGQSAPAGLMLRPVAPSPFGDTLLAGTVTIGRGRSATLRFDAKEAGISRRHCRLEQRDDDIVLIDENTDNGTFLNGNRIQEAIVSAGDRIRVADSHYFDVAAIVGDSAASPRVATATALDNCEIVRIPVAALREAAPADERVAQLAAELTRLLRSGGPSAPADQAFLRRLVDLNLYNSQNTLLIDLERCTRCDECVRACADAHDGVPRFTRDGPRFGKYLVTLACRSCTDPKCMVGCPVSSIRRTESLEVHIEDWCVGCGLCANNCPFGNINMVEVAAPAEPPAAAAAPQGPVDLTTGALRATVCDLCAGYDGPSCVYACPHDAAIRVNPGAFLSPSDLQIL